MKATIKEDIIVAIGDAPGSVEIGKLPRNVGLERLRWTGKKIVDIEKLNELWVRPITGGGFELHAIEVPGSQLVRMNYIKDRKKLHVDGDAVIVKAQEEAQIDERERALLKKAFLDIKGVNEKQNEMDMVLLCLLSNLIVYSIERPPELKALFESLVPHIKNAFPVDKWEGKAIGFAKRLKEILDNYNKKI